MKTTIKFLLIFSLLLSVKVVISQVYRIPTVFHIIHNYGDENISMAQVDSAMAIINRDYRKRNADTAEIVDEFKSLAADAKIEFVLANRDPDGNPTTGITRYAHPKTIVEFPVDEIQMKDSTGWPRDKYLNIWIFGALRNNMAGGAYQPNSAAIIPDWDGVYIRHDYLGNIGTAFQKENVYYATRILTHEIGHFLGLQHTWGKNPNPKQAINCNDDDGIDDTPNCIGFYPSSNQINCSEAFMGSKNTCPDVGIDTIDNLQNFMTYSYCQKMFTPGQVAVMHTALNSSTADRNNLWTDENLIITGTHDTSTYIEPKPIGDFNFDICHDSVQFHQNVYHTREVVTNWTFEGGTPATSTEENPKIFYNATGIYNVSLIATNSAGADTTVKENSVIIKKGIDNYYIEDFKNSSFPDNSNDDYDWEIDTENEPTKTWKQFSNDDFNALYLNASQNNSGDKNILITPYIYIENETPILYYKYAYAKSGNNFDNLKIYTNTSCDDSEWENYYNATVDNFWSYPTENNFVPDEDDWIQDSVLLDKIVPEDIAFRVKFEFEIGGGTGGYLYLDSIGVKTNENWTVKNIKQNNKIKIFPNPISNNTELKIILNKQNSADYKIEIIDITGRKLFAENYKNNKEIIVKKNAISKLIKGVYFVKIINDDKTITKKIIKN